MAFIREHAGTRTEGGLAWGVEPMCRVLSEHGVPIAPSTYYEHRDRQPSRRDLRDAEIVELLLAQRDHRFRCRYGARKMWLHLRRQGHDVARCTVERLMAQQGMVGVTRGRRHVTTVSDAGDQRPQDLVDRDFTTMGPDQLWVADFTYCPTWEGMVYVAFILDVFSRRILGWRAAMRMTTDLVLDALEQALWMRAKEGKTELAGLIAHTDAGSQYLSIAYTERLFEAGVDPSVGSVGDAYDNALAESTIGLFKSELIWPEGPWRDRAQLEAAVMDWVHWFNTERTHEAIDDLTPLELENLHYRQTNARLAETG